MTVSVAAALTIAVGGPAGAKRVPKPPKGVYAWGFNGVGELGDGTSSNGDFSAVPVAVVGLPPVKEMATGGISSLALMKNGTVMAWGYNAYGQDGNGTCGEIDDVPGLVTVPTSTPGVRAPLTGVKAVAVEDLGSSLALMDNGTVMAWGLDDGFALGLGMTASPVCTGLPSSVNPVLIPGLSKVKAISGGYDTGYALLKMGTVMAWGANDFDQLGNGTNSPHTIDTPVQVPNLTGVTAISGSGDSALALTGGTVLAWGASGLNRTDPAPVPVSGVSGAVAISDGGGTGMALLSNGTVMGWGVGGGAVLGTNPPGAFDAVLIANLSSVKEVSDGGPFALALLTNGTVETWGTSVDGILGTGAVNPTPTPTAINGLSHVKAVSASQGNVDPFALANQ
jgi:alpha-tubulin suppressor-like RCC1 family protein